MGGAVHRRPAPVPVLCRLQAGSIILADLPEEHLAMALTATDLKVPVGYSDLQGETCGSPLLEPRQVSDACYRRCDSPR